MRTQWRLAWLGNIEEMSNLEMQQATWLNAACNNPHYTYYEYRVCYLDDRATADTTYGYTAILRDGYINAKEAQRRAS